MDELKLDGATEAYVEAVNNKITERLDAMGESLSKVPGGLRWERDSNGLWKQDAPGYVFARTALIEVESKVHEVLYQKLQAADHIVFDSSYDRFATQIEYRQMDVFGIAADAEPDSDVFPMVSTTENIFRGDVFEAHSGYYYTDLELGRGRLEDIDVLGQRARANATAIQRWHDRLALDGKGASTGFANDANVPLVPSAGGGGWQGATGAQMYDDLAALLVSIPIATDGHFKPNALAVPTGIWATISSTTPGVDNFDSVLRKLQHNFPGVSISEWSALAGRGAGGGDNDRIVAYVKDADVSKYRAQVMYEEYPAMKVNSRTTINAFARASGIVMYQPLAHAYMDIDLTVAYV